MKTKHSETNLNHIINKQSNKLVAIFNWLFHNRNNKRARS